MFETRNWCGFAALAALTALLGGCPGRIDDPTSFRERAAASCPSEFDVERDLFARTCGSLGCHTGGDAIAAAGLDLTTPGIGDRLMAHVSTECDGRRLVTPGNVADSYLLDKVGETPECGSRMPANAGRLNLTEQSCLEQYLAQLAGVDELESDAGAVGGFDAGAPPPPVDAGTPVDPPVEPPVGTPRTYEAEEMLLTNYVVDPGNPEVIRLPDGVATGTAIVDFDGEPGRYYLTVNAVAENDGQPQLTVRVGVTELFTVTYPLGAEGMETLVLGPYEVDLAVGDVIAVEGVAEAGAWARVDSLEVLP